MKSAQVPTQDDFLRATGSTIKSGIIVPSIFGWYEGPTKGIGTPAHWRRARITALKQLGYDDDVIREDYIRTGELVYKPYIHSLTEDDINQLYHVAYEAVPAFS